MHDTFEVHQLKLSSTVAFYMYIAKTVSRSNGAEVRSIWKQPILKRGNLLWRRNHRDTYRGSRPRLWEPAERHWSEETSVLKIMIDWWSRWSSIDDKTKLLMIMIFYLFLLFPALGHQNRHNLRFLFFWGFFLRLCFLPTLLCHPPPLSKSRFSPKKKSKTTTSPRKENVQ